MHPNIISIYNEFLYYSNTTHLEQRQLLKEGRFSASSAGLCAKKLWYERNEFEGEPFDNDTLRIFRLGTIVGDDLETAMKWWGMCNNDWVVYTEEYVYDDYLNVGGSFDLLLVNRETRNGYLYDYKTAKSWSFTQKTGNPRNKLPQSYNYEFQLGTYANLICSSTNKFGKRTDKNQFECDNIVYMGLVFYNKDDSRMATIDVDNEYIKWAKEYWIKAVEIANQKESPSNQKLIPYYSNWECKEEYCRFWNHCDSEFRTEKKKGKK